MALLPLATTIAPGLGVAQEYVDRRSLVRSYDRIASNATEFSQAASELATQHFGAIWVDGLITPTAAVAIPDGVSLRGLGPGAGILRNPGVSITIGNSAVFPYGTNLGRHQAPPLKDDLPEGSSDIVAQDLSAAVGDWILLISDNEITNRPWHKFTLGDPSKTNPGHPSEMYQVGRVYTNGVDQVYRLEGFNSQAMTTVPATAADNTTALTFTVSGTTLTTQEAPDHNFFAGQSLYLDSTGTLPSPFTARTPYYVRNPIGKTFSLTTTPGTAGGALLSGSGGSGTHRLHFPPRAYKLEIHKQTGRSDSNVVIDNLFFGSTDPSAAVTLSSNMLQVYNLDGVEVTNCRFGLNAGFDPAGQITIERCANVSIHHNVWESSVGWKDDGTPEGDAFAYAIVIVGACNGVHVHHNNAGRCSHFVTTGGRERTSGGVTRRYGDPVRILVENNILFDRQAVGGGGSWPLDAHVEGYAPVFRNNLIFCRSKQWLPASSQGGRAFSTRARRTQFLDNVVIGDGGSATGGVLAIALHAPECVAKGNVLIDVMVAVRTLPYDGQAGEDLGWDNCTAEDNTILYSRPTTATGKPLQANGGSNHIFCNNKITGAAGGAFSSEAGDGIRYVGNQHYDCGDGTGAVVSFDTGSGDDNQVMDNDFSRCDVESLIKFTAGTGHRVSKNEGHKDLNTYFLDVGTTIAAANIKVIANTADGYGSGILGLKPTGSNATAVEAAYAAKNWTD